MNTRHRALVALAAFATVPLLVLACSSAPAEEAPSRQPIPTANPTATDADAGEGPDAACFGPDQCFKCEPVELVQFLNACTDGKCIPFDNAARLPLYKAGEPLPPVP